MSDAPQPLAGTIVVDLSRMLPGAVLARQLLDLGARLIKIEDPAGGDPMRSVPPLVGGMGAGFAAFFRGAQSVCLDLRRDEDAAALARLARRADVLVESFRPGTLARWGLEPARLAAANPRLVVCSLPAYPGDGPRAERVGHDLNFVGSSGLLSLLPGAGVPGIQLADVTAGLLAAASILAALLQRAATGRGSRIEQPLAAAPLVWLTWQWADAAAGGPSGAGLLLGGRTPCYRLYRCGDGRLISLGAIEPKFWLGFLRLLGLEELAAAGMDPGEEGRRAVEAIEGVLATRPREHWLRLAEAHRLPVGPVDELPEARAALLAQEPALVERVGTPSGEPVEAPGPALAQGLTPDRPAPALGEHTAAVLAELAG